MVATAYGVTLLVAGWLMARGVDVAERWRVFARLERPETGSEAAADRTLPRVGLATIGFVAIAIPVGYALFGPIGVPLGALTPPMVARRHRIRRRDRLATSLEGQLQEAVVGIAAGLRAGLSIRLAVADARRDAESPFEEALERVLHRLELGEPLDVSLEHLGRELNVRDAELVTSVLRIHRRTGGDLPTLLDSVAEVIGRRANEQRHLRALTAQAKVSGVVLAALPVAFIALLSGAGGDGLGAFYRSPAGAALLLSGIGLDALGFAWMQRIVRGVEGAG